MKILIVTVAGMSERFSRSVGYSCIKCLYSGSKPHSSLIYRLTHMYEFDKYIIVGGFRYDDLCEGLKCELADIYDKIVLVNNEKYALYGSGYSLYMGLAEALKYDFSEIVFAEGDLFLDSPSFEKVCRAEADVITTNSEPICASSSVAFYSDVQEKIHYIYDVSHNYLEIKEPFLSIRNSGQVWKLYDPKLVCRILSEMPEEQHTGTNLIFIEKYFNLSENVSFIGFDKWINCNTVDDYNKIGE